MFWYLVMAISNGITQAAANGLPCAPINYRQLHTQLDATQITDPQLKQETSQFYKDCYVPAYSDYLSGKLTPAQQMQVQQSLKQNGSGDIGWMGSQTFLNITGFYDARQASQPINGFAFNPERDYIDGQVNGHSQWGHPDCKQWWDDPENGLSARLGKTLPTTFWQQLENLGGNSQQLHNAAIKTLIGHNNINQSISDKTRGYESLNDNASGNWISRFIGAPIGVMHEGLSFYPKLDLLINALPVIQGSLLFALYAFLGLAVPFSSYRIQFCITGAIVIFSVIFCSYLWALTQWFDNYLIQALYPSLGKIPGMDGILNDITSPNESFVDMIIAALYIVLPLLWLTVMGWAGFQAGQHVANMVGSMSMPATNAGNKSASVTMKQLS